MDRSDRRLRRDSRDAFVAGVCKGLGDYFDVDPALVRAFFVASAAIGGFGPALYLALWILLDDEATVSPLREPRVVNSTEERGAGPVAAEGMSSAEVEQEDVETRDETVDLVAADWIPLP